MTSVKLDLSTDDTTPIYEYTGAELEPPLRALHEHLMSAARKLREEQGNAPKREMPALRKLVQPDPRDVSARIAALTSEAFEARLWAAECQRKPSSRFRLRMQQIRWLYQQTRESI